MLVLIEKGRVEVMGDSFRWVTEAMQAMPFREAALTHTVALESRRLALPHGDPADRFLAADGPTFTP